MGDRKNSWTAVKDIWTSRELESKTFQIPKYDDLKKLYFFNKGWWAWHLLIVCYLCLIGSFLHVRSKLYDQETDGQVDYGCVNILLLNLHRRPILPGILHSDPRSNYLGTWSSSHVECQVYLSVSG